MKGVNECYFSDKKLSLNVHLLTKFAITLCGKSEYTNMNRIRIILAEHNKTNKWLAEQLGKSETTVSRWVQNKNQPSINQLVEIAKILNIDAKDLLETTLVK